MLFSGRGAFGAEPDESARTALSADRIKPPYQTPNELFNLYQPYLKNIAAYEPMYFLVGADPGESKFQISMKYRFLNPGKTLERRHPLLEGLYFGYTQTSYWDLSSDSHPFDDTSYKPEIFFISPHIFKGLGFSHVFFQTGLRHESNGQGGEKSRSTNFLYFQPMLVFFHESSGIGVGIVPKIWTYVNNDDETNPDLYAYRGYFDLGVKVGKPDGLVLETHYRQAKEGLSIRFDLNYPLDRLINTRLQVYLHAQYVNALAESLLDYQDRSNAFRLGFSIVR
jgi:outer membrane phospholipase A